MSLLTTIDIQWTAKEASDFDRLQGMADWLANRQREGHVIVAESAIGIDEAATLACMIFFYRGRFRFVDRKLALMFKLIFG